MKFTKKEFEENYLPKGKKLNIEDNNIEELHDLDGDFGGDKPELVARSQVTSNTQKSSIDDKSGYKSKVTDLDSHIAKTHNKLSRFNPFGPAMGNYFGVGGVYENTTNEAKGKMEELIKELLNNYSSTREIVDKVSPEDINNNNVMDIDEINKPEVITTMNKFISSVSSSELNEDELGTVIYHTIKTLNEKGVDFKKMSRVIKDELKKIIQ